MQNFTYGFLCMLFWFPQCERKKIHKKAFLTGFCSHKFLLKVHVCCGFFPLNLGILAKWMGFAQ